MIKKYLFSICVLCFLANSLMAVKPMVAAFDSHIAGLKSDGTVVAVGWNDLGQCNVGNWTDIVQIDVGGAHTVGLKSDGTVVAVGAEGDPEWEFGQCDVGSWKNIIQVAAGDLHTVGLKSDGTVVAAGWNGLGQCNVSGWTNIIQVVAGGAHTVGLKSDGTVVAVGWNENGQCNVSNWNSIILLARSYYHTVGLKTDGTVVAVGWNDSGQCNLSDWTNIIQVAAGDTHTVGLKSDGTVVARGNISDQSDIDNWIDIMQVTAGYFKTLGLKKDGTVVCNGNCFDANEWKLLVDQIPIADAGSDQPCVVGDTIQLDGSKSCDPDGDPITYHWQIVSKPEGSYAQLSDSMIVNPSIQLDVAGEYDLSLVVNDGHFDSKPSPVTITAVSIQESMVDLTLSASEITFSSQNPRMGETITISADVQNIGNMNADNVSVKFFDQDQLIGEKIVTLVRPGSSAKTSILWTAARDGFYLIKVVIDPANFIRELNEENNEATRSILVGECTGLGGIIVSGKVAPSGNCLGFYVTVSGDAKYDTTFGAGEPVAGADVTIKIMGGESWATHTIRNGRYEYTITAPFQPGDYIVLVTVTDYTFSKTIEMTLKANAPMGIDILPRRITFSDNRPVEGDFLSISADIHNVGQLEATNVLVRFYNGASSIGEQLISSLPGGNSQTVTVTWLALPSGTYRLRVIVDPENSISEDCEQNNQRYEDLHVYPAIPDLTPQAIFFSNERPLVNQQINIYALVKNIGGSGANDLVIRFCDGSKIIGEQNISHLDGKGAISSMNFPYATMEAGWHTIRIIADPDNFITEDCETNNEYSVMLYVHGPAPELAILVEDISFSNPRPTVGDIVTIYARIHNIGELAAAHVLVKLQDDTEVIGLSTIPLISPGETETIQISWTAVPVGNHWIRVLIDPDNQIEESYENNNVASRSIYVYPLHSEPVPDLLVYSEDIIFSNTNPQEGEGVKVYATIHNILEAEARNIAVDFFVDNTRIGSQVIPAIMAKKEETLMAQWVATLLGSHVVKVVVDPLYHIVESDKDNNTATRGIIVGGLADLAIEVDDLIFSKSDPREGEIITISANIHNIGKSQASSTLVGFYEGDPAGSGAQIGSLQLIPILQAGEVCEVQLQWATEGKVGNHQIYVVVDPTNTTSEENELNNQVHKNLEVQNSNQPPIVNTGENITIRTIDKLTTVIQGTATDQDQGDSLQYRWKEGNMVLLDWAAVGANGECLLNMASASLGIGTHTLILEVTDDQETVTDEMILTIENSAPHAAPSGGGVYEINSTVTLGGNVSDFDGDSLTYKWLEGEAVLFDGAVQTPAGGEPVGLPNQTKSTLCLGIHTMTLQVTDGINAPVSSSISVQIVDTTVPTLAPVANQTILWPPNHKLVDITIQTNAADNSGVVTVAATIASNEPVDGLGDGDTAPDWTQPIINQQTGQITFQLGAERSGSGNGRIYTVTVSATDNSNNTSTAKVEIIVPHDKKK